MTSDRPLSSENRSLPEIRQLPAVEPRLESGPVAFGDDWPGLFIRGDHAANFAVHLRAMLGTGPLTWVSRAVVEGLLADLESTNLVKRNG